MAEFVRPAPDLDKITQAWRLWADPERDAETLPGRTMADLKIGGADKVIEAIRVDNPGQSEVETVAKAWHLWESGRTGPAEALAALAAGGFDRIVAALNGE